MSALIVGGILAVFVAALLGGLTGFGYNLVATPLLLLLGVHPATAVSVNLVIALVTRVAVVFRLRRHVRWRRALPLILGSIPGLMLGAVVGGALEPTGIRIVAGAAVLVVAPLVVVRRPKSGDKRPVQYAGAGLLGGALGTSTSLNGAPVALTLSADAHDQRSFIADLAVYFVVSNLIGLTILSVRDGVDPNDFVLLAWWLPASLVANWLGTALSPRLAPRAFRLLTCLLLIAAGAVTIVTA